MGKENNFGKEKKMLKKVKVILITGVLMVGLVGVTSVSQAQKLEKVLFLVPRPSVDVFDDVIFVVAEKMGYFAEEGLDVRWEGTKGGTDCTRLVATGAADFGYPSEMIMSISIQSGMDIVNVFQIDQMNVFDFGVRPDSGLTRLEQLKGKTIALGSASWAVICDPILRAAGLDPEKDVKYISVGEQRAQAVLAERADALLTWEMEWQLWRDQGIELGIIYGDPRFHVQGNCYCASRKMVKERPDIIEKFLRASTKGLVFAAVNPAAGAEMVLKKFPRIKCSWKAAVENVEICIGVKRSLDSQLHGFGWANLNLWRKNVKGMVVSGALKSYIDPSSFTTHQFVGSANDFDYERIIAQAQSYKLKSHEYPEDYEERGYILK